MISCPLEKGVAFKPPWFVLWFKLCSALFKRPLLICIMFCFSLPPFLCFAGLRHLFSISLSFPVYSGLCFQLLRQFVCSCLVSPVFLFSFPVSDLHSMFPGLVVRLIVQTLNCFFFVCISLSLVFFFIFIFIFIFFVCLKFLSFFEIKIKDDIEDTTHEFMSIHVLM